MLEFFLFVCVAGAACVFFAIVIFDIVNTYVQNAAHDKILCFQEDIDKTLSPYSLQVMYSSNNRWIFYDSAYNKAFSRPIPANKLLSLLRKLKYRKITIGELLDYLTVTEVKHLKNLQKSKEL